MAALKTWYPGHQSTARIHLEPLAKILSNAGVYCDSKTVGKWARNLGLEVKQTRIGEESKKGVEITKAQLDDLVERFGV